MWSFSGSAADPWFPTEKHYRFYMMLVRFGRLQVKSGMHRAEMMTDVMEVPVPAIRNLDLRDIIRLRMNSAVLEDWRTRLSGVLTDIGKAGDPYPRSNVSRRYAER